jgi:hypothetical protein
LAQADEMRAQVAAQRLRYGLVCKQGVLLQIVWFQYTLSQVVYRQAQAQDLFPQLQSDGFLVRQLLVDVMLTPVQLTMKSHLFEGLICQSCANPDRLEQDKKCFPQLYRCEEVVEENRFRMSYLLLNDVLN